MIDLKRTLQLVKGALFDAEQTWRDYLPEAGDWKKTAYLLTGPLIVASVLIAYVLGLLSSDTSLFGQFRPTIVSSLLNIVTSAIAAGVIGFIFSGLAGVFGGKDSFALGLAATTLAFVPGYAGQALTWLPWIGGLLALALFIYAMVLLWKIIPIYLDVPDGKRAGHYILSVVATIVVMFVISSVVGRVLYPGGPGVNFGAVSDTRPSGRAGGGMFGGVMQQAELMAAAEDDRYTPPANGKLREEQVENFIRIMDRSNEMMEEKGQRIRELAEKADSKQKASISDVSQMMTGMTQIAGLNTIEMEVVKSGGGNWAEHQWVKEALRTAWIQKDINDIVRHNYEIYEDHEDELANFVAR